MPKKRDQGKTVRCALLTLDEAVAFTSALRESEINRFATVNDEVRGDNIFLTIEVEGFASELLLSSLSEGLLSLYSGKKFMSPAKFA